MNQHRVPDVDHAHDQLDEALAATERGLLRGFTAMTKFGHRSIEKLHSLLQDAGDQTSTDGSEPRGHNDPGQTTQSSDLNAEARAVYEAIWGKAECEPTDGWASHYGPLVARLKALFVDSSDTPLALSPLDLSTIPLYGLTLHRTWKVGERVEYVKSAKEPQFPESVRTGTVHAIEDSLRRHESLVIAFDDGETRAINPDVMRHIRS